ncbi:hypothetical protein [Streptomyces sp. NBC_01618]|uniref:hypothetical protein n=1 Tax=Streptomyces sp. NBC_01618 TaxID=2975900 RepID=UPI00386BCE5F|nr:hypothetical protein OH735_15945 [Streptomyces sp. NBC_01618]
MESAAAETAAAAAMAMAMAMAVVLGMGGAAAAAPGNGAVAGAAGGIAPEADVSHHGHVSLWGSGLGVWVQSVNYGPSNLADVTVRVRTSVSLSRRQELPEGCLQADRLTVLCRTGALRTDEAEGRQLALELQLAGWPDEVVVRVDTLWNGGATDRNPQNNDHEVLALATGDEYVF